MRLRHDGRDSAPRFGLKVPNFADQIVTIDARHSDVADQNIRNFRAERGDSFSCGTCKPHLCAVVFKSLLQQVARIRFVVDNQDRQTVKAIGRVIPRQQVSRAWMHASSRCIDLVNRTDRQLHSKRRTVADTLAGGPHSSAMKFD